jgi:hypothetical protein
VVWTAVRALTLLFSRTKRKRLDRNARAGGATIAAVMAGDDRRF